MATSPDSHSEIVHEKSTQLHNRNGLWVRLKHLSADRQAWLWLVVGFVLLPFTAWQTVIPLAAWLAPMFLLRFVRTSSQKRSMTMISLAYAAGTLIAMRGMFSNNLLADIGLLILMPLFRSVAYTLPYRADRLIGTYMSDWGRTLAFPIAFTVVDWVMSLLPAITTAGSPAYSQVNNLTVMQMLSITGMWGLTFLIAWFASTANELWEHEFDWRRGGARLGPFAGIFLGVVLYGSLRLAFAAPTSPAVRVATITIDSTTLNSASSSINWSTFNQSTDAQRAAVRPKFQATVDQMLARSETALRGGAKIIGWEEASAMVLEEDKANVLSQASSLAKQYGGYLQISLEVFTRSGRLPYIHNESILIDDTGRLLWTYDKTHPVVGESALTFSGPGKLPVVDTPFGLLSTAICNDMAFPPLIRQSGWNGVGILIAPTSDNAAIDQHTMAIARAIENGTSLVRPTGNGVSVITDYEGRVSGSQDYFTSSDGILSASVPTRGVTTIYSRIGDLFAYLCVAALVFLLGRAWMRREKGMTVSSALVNKP